MDANSLNYPGRAPGGLNFSIILEVHAKKNNGNLVFDGITEFLSDLNKFWEE